MVDGFICLRENMFTFTQPSCCKMEELASGWGLAGGKMDFNMIDREEEMSSGPSGLAVHIILCFFHFQHIFR